MLGLYLGTLAFGAVVVGASVLLGGGGDGADVDHGGDMDLDGDAGADLHVDAEADFGMGEAADAAVQAHGEHALQTAAESSSIDWLWLPFLSLRFWSFAAASFGAVGSLLSLAGISEWVTVPVSAVAGVGIGWSASWIFRQLQVRTVTGSTTLARFVGEQGKVVLAVRGASPGMVRLQTAAGDVEFPATTGDHSDIPAGATVLVAGFEGRTASVTALPTLPQGRVG